MNRILKYELKRLLLNKFFIGLCVINGIFSWYTLTSDTIAGVAYTAPFSSWSFSAYLASVMPISILTVLFLLSIFHSKNEKQVAVLTAATPINTSRYTLVRLTVIALGFFFLCALVIGMSIIFYATFFHFWNYSVFILPAIITILPCFVFALGAGNLLGRIHRGFLYGLMLVSLATNFIPLPETLNFTGIFGSGFYANFPMSLPLAADGDPAYTLSAAFLAVRAFYLVIGVVLLAVSVCRTRSSIYRNP